ncbi:MAG: thioredoxin domain-containing protein [Thermoanaerobaculales bacterium]|nr:thioredoxin domain-containing protein [Thermoanaerobaculales bacterium]
MRMRLCRLLVLAAPLAVATVTTTAAVAAEPEPDLRALRYVERAIAWYPESSFRLLENTRYQTAQGSYRFVSIDRSCASTVLSEQPTALIDETTDSIWLGSVGQLPGEAVANNPEALKNFLSSFLPEALRSAMNLRVKVEWDSTPRRPSAVIPLSLLVDSGFGTVRRAAGVTADGRFLVMAGEAPLKEDPVAARRRLFLGSELVIWDSAAAERAAVEIVEFSDFECPACRGKWPLIQMVLGKHGSRVRHGLVSYPLTAIHPWAFRAASATWCVGAQDPQLVIPLKETFYALQKDMGVSEVTTTALDFVAGNGLDEAGFRGCYLRDPSIAAVHGQMALGNAVNVHATPTYFVNGWMVQVPDGSWFPDLVERLLAGDEP